MSFRFQRFAAPALAALLLGLAFDPAFAQPVTPDTPPPGQEDDEGTPDSQTAPDDPCAIAPGVTRDEGDLTGQLSDCNGVLTPPPTAGGEMQAPVPDPDPNTTPVVPPGSVPEQPAQ